jgi:hypothetical protein
MIAGVTPLSCGATLTIGRHVFGVELAGGRECPCSEAGGWSAVHQERNTDRLGRLLWARATQNRTTGVGGDAAFALLAHGDSQRNELLGLGVQHTRLKRRIMQMLVRLVHAGDDVPYSRVFARPKAHRPTAPPQYTSRT